MKALALCAGLGTRLRPLTDTIPKPLIEIGGKPLLVHHLEAARAAGVTEVAINLHHLGQMIRTAIGDGSSLGLEITYADEPELRGSAGAIGGFPGFFDQRFLVIYADVYAEIDFGALAAFHASRSAMMTLAATTADDPTRCGVLTINDETGRVEQFIEKPRTAPADVPVNAGFYICEPRVAALVPPGNSDFGSDLIPLLVATGEPVFAMRVPGPVQDIGTPDGLERARQIAALPH